MTEKDSRQQKKQASGNQTEKQQKKQSGSQPDRQTKKQSGSQSDRQTKKQSGSQPDKQTKKQSGSQLDRQTKKQSGSQLDRQTKKQSGSQTDKQQQKQRQNRQQDKQQKERPAGRSKKEALSSKQRREQEVHHAKVIIACAAISLFVILFLIIVLPILTGSKTVNKGKLTGVNSDVLQYETSVEAYCKEYHISQFSTLMLAIMQQESSGQGTDIFQCSESPFNTEYSNSPGSITDPDYSIRVGVETFAYCLELAGCKRISDMDKVKLALQEYNFGNDYINWAVSNYGGYSQENAYEFSEMMKAQLGWDTYGDPEYVQHVLQYYTQ